MRYATIFEPPLERTIRVDQRGIGFLSDDMEKDYLETTELITCVALYTRSEDVQFLCHIDRNPLISPERQAEIFMRFAYPFGIDEVYSLCSTEADKETLRVSESVFDEFGPERITLERKVVDIIFDKNGRMYEIEPLTIRDYMKSPPDMLLYVERLSHRRGLLCANTGTVIGYDDIRA